MKYNNLRLSEIKNLIKATLTPRDKLLILSAFYLPLRIDKLLSLKVTEILQMIKQKKIVIHDLGIIDNFLEELNSYLDMKCMDDFVFHSQKGGHVSRPHFYKVINDAARSVKIDKYIGETVIRNTVPVLLQNRGSQLYSHLENAENKNSIQESLEISHIISVSIKFKDDNWLITGNSFHINNKIATWSLVINLSDLTLFDYYYFYSNNIYDTPIEFFEKQIKKHVLENRLEILISKHLPLDCSFKDLKDNGLSSSMFKEFLMIVCEKNSCF